jgi:hypothetical protein
LKVYGAEQIMKSNKETKKRKICILFFIQTYLE